MYKVKNKTESVIRIGEITFGAKETKIMESKPYSDRFEVEEVEEKAEVEEKKRKKIKGD